MKGATRMIKHLKQDETFAKKEEDKWKRATKKAFKNEWILVENEYTLRWKPINIHENQENIAFTVK